MLEGRRPRNRGFRLSVQAVSNWIGCPRLAGRPSTNKIEVSIRETGSSPLEVEPRGHNRYVPDLDASATIWYICCHSFTVPLTLYIWL
jgi:hypothetical protein